MIPMIPFIPSSGSNKIFNSQIIPKELDIYFQSEKDLLPEGKDFADLTQEEMNTLNNQYRFSPYRPGLYQTITGFNGFI